MNVELRVLARPEAAAGFALAGIPPVEYDTPTEGVARLRELSDDPGIGLILVDDATYHHVPEDLRRRLARRSLPIVVPFPAPRWEAGPVVDEYIVELLRQVIGYRVRLR